MQNVYPAITMLENVISNALRQRLENCRFSSFLLPISRVLEGPGTKQKDNIFCEQIEKKICVTTPFKIALIHLNLFFYFEE